MILGVLVAGAAMVGLLALSWSSIEDVLTGATPNLGAANACLQQRDVKCAEADYRAYLRRYPNDGPTTALLAIVLTQDGQHQDALPYYRRALALGVSTYDLYANYAVSLNTTGAVDEAIKQNKAALNLVPSLVDVRGALADELAKQGRGKEALDVLESFDQSLIQQGQPPYFPSQIARIRTNLGLPPEGADPNGTAGAATGKSEIALQLNNGALFVPVVVNGAITLNFMLDSGASDVCIPYDVARTLIRMGKLTESDSRGMGVAVLADGSRVPARRVMIKSLEVGGHTVRNVLASVTVSRGSLLLGQSFLQKFKSWSIDNNRRILKLQE